MIRPTTSAKDLFELGGRINGVSMCWGRWLLQGSRIGDEVVRVCADLVFLCRIRLKSKRVP